MLTIHERINNAINISIVIRNSISNFELLVMAAKKYVIIMKAAIIMVNVSKIFISSPRSYAPSIVYKMIVTIQFLHSYDSTYIIA